MHASKSVGPKTPDLDHPARRFSVVALRGATLRRMRGGQGSGELCDFCVVPINPADLVYEVDARISDQPVSLRFHVGCYGAWKAGRDPT